MTAQTAAISFRRPVFAWLRTMGLSAFSFLCMCATLHAQNSTASSTAQKTTVDADTKGEGKSDTKGEKRYDAGDYRREPADWVTKTYPLHYAAQQNDANEILVAVRNIVAPWTKLFLVTSQSVIVVLGPPDQQQRAEQLIHELDQPKKSYKLTYTLTENDAGKRVGMQHYSLFVVTGQRSTLKQGSKVPVLVGTAPGSGSSAPLQNFQYIDVGMNLDATIDPYNGGLRLRTKVEQSSTSEDKTISMVAEPIIRQSVIEEVAILSTGKSVNLGSLEVPGTTRRIDIEVVAEPVP